MTESINSWADLITYLPVLITIVPYLIWLAAFRSAYVSQSGNRGIWLLVLGVTLFVFPLGGAIAYFIFKDSPALANLPKGRTFSEFMNNAKQIQDQKDAAPNAPDFNPDTSVKDVADIKTHVPNLDQHDFSTHVPPLPDKPSDKYEVLK